MVDVTESARRENPAQVNRLHMRGEIDHGVLGGGGGGGYSRHPSSFVTA